MNTGKCPIWPDSPATMRDWNRSVVVDSPRAGGYYRITGLLPSLNDEERACLTTLLVDSRNQRSGQWGPLVTPELIERARRAQPLAVHDRAERLLRFVEKQSKAVGDTVDLYWAGSGRSDTDRHAMAWSESTTMQQIWFLLDYLIGQGWIERRAESGNVVTVEGYRRIAEVRTNPDARQVFVAMWFDREMDVVYEHGIEPAIKNAGYKPMRIDQKEDAVKIDDEIIAEIRRSRFLVADFTHGKAGARGGVYFEAGFAFGLGIPVIYTCREDAVDLIHFDTRQYHHTLWKGPEDLRDRLEKRILAVIGEGPRVSTGSQDRSAAG